MEYALWVPQIAIQAKLGAVLILILMEYALWGGRESQDGRIHIVLILILMEYALWDALDFNLCCHNCVS